MISFLKWLNGYLTLLLTGPMVERCFNHASRENLLLWNIKVTKDGYYCNISQKAFPMLKDLARKSGTKLSIHQEHGLPFFLKRHRKRKNVFYPEDGVSPMQKRQMKTQEGGNVGVCAIKGNFDDCQNGVKAIFTDSEVKALLDENGMMFSSANSINWGRLVPQIVYYVSAYAELAKDGEIELGEKINVVVPTGNFGNILAAYYAKHMGVPINKLICASNINNVLTDFINTGVYDRNRQFYATVSPSMDILISSNLERLLYLMTGKNDAVIREWFGKLASEGRYEVSDDVKAKLDEEFCAGFCDDDQTENTIHAIYEKYSYTCDTHTAVAVKVYNDYKAATGDETKTVIASTASPYKFSAAVLAALESGNEDMDEYSKVDRIAQLSDIPVPSALADLKNKPERFGDVIEKADQKAYVLRTLGL